MSSNTRTQIFSLINPENKETYRATGKSLIKKLGIPTVTRLWNNSGLSKREAKETTIKRWLSPGPHTKNPQFEGFATALNSDLRNIVHETMIEEKMARLDQAIECNEFLSKRELATAASLVSFYKIDRNLSRHQTALVSDIVSRLPE